MLPDDSMPPRGDRRWLLASAVAGAVVAVASSFVGWGRSGSAVRSAYGLYDAADDAGLLSDTATRFGWVLFVAPPLVGLALVVLGLGRDRLAAVLLLLGSSVITTTSAVVVASPVIVEPGAIVALASGAVGAVAAIAILLRTRWQRHE